jgi:hypothetical protein
MHGPACIFWADLTPSAPPGIGQRKQVKVFRLIAEATMEARACEGARAIPRPPRSFSIQGNLAEWHHGREWSY